MNEPGYARPGRRRRWGYVDVHCFFQDCGSKLGEVQFRAEGASFHIPNGYRPERGVYVPTKRLDRMIREGRGPDPQADSRRSRRLEREDRFASERMSFDERMSASRSSEGEFFGPAQRWTDLPVQLACSRCRHIQLVSADRLASARGH
jgi:hypothetical protein